MKKTVALVVAALLAGGATAWYLHEGTPTATVARKMPAFEALDLDGQRLTSADLAGGPTMISVFERDCGSCRREVEHLNELQRLYPEVRMIAMTFNSPEAARAFKDQSRLQWRVLPGQGEFITEAGVPATPAQLFYDSRGNLVGHRLGWPLEDGRQAEARARLDEWMTHMLASGKAGSPS